MIVGRPRLGRDRERVDDLAAAPRDHAGHDRLGEEERRREVRRDHAVPGLGREILDRRAVLDAGVVDQDLDRPVRALDACDERLHRGAVEEVAHLGARGADGLRPGLELFPVAPDHHHRGARRREPFRHGEAKPRAAAGDERGLLGEVEGRAGHR